MTIRKLVVHHHHRFYPVDHRQIRFISIEDGVISVFGRSHVGNLLFRTLAEVEAHLDERSFWRCHKSHIVNVHHVAEVIRLGEGRFLLVMDDDVSTQVKVSRGKQADIDHFFAGLPIHRRDKREQSVAAELAEVADAHVG
jgi:DNA-binding LytR/AlgR family response regulator